jgi:hypothetical protein
VDAVGAGLFVYLTMFCSYAEALWSMSERETTMVISTFWRSMGAMLNKIKLAQIELQLGLVASGKDLLTEDVLMNFCENGLKARIRGKVEQLNRAKALVNLAKEFLNGEPLAVLHELFLGGVEQSFYVLSGRNRLSLSRPHKMQRLIF